MSPEELCALEQGLKDASARLGGIAVLVEWGQPFGGPVSEVKYHLKEDIADLLQLYRQHNLNGICPKAGLVVDCDWIGEQRKRIERVRQCTPVFDFKAYLDFATHTKF